MIGIFHYHSAAMSYSFRRKLPDKTYLELGRRDLVLRTLTEEDSELVYQWRRDYAEYFFSPGPSSTEAQRKWFRKYKNVPEDIVFMIERRERPVGMVSLYEIDLEESQGAFGRFLVTADVRGQGVGKQAARYVVDFARTLGLSKLYLSTSTKNVAAVKLYEDMGFKEQSRDGEVLQYLLRL